MDPSSIVTPNDPELLQAPGVSINATTITEVKTVKYFKVYVVGLDLFNSVTLSVSLYDENSSTVGNRTFMIEGAEYLSWNNDDQYLIDLVAQKLGFTLSA
jgi:hypothetical protein